jgi:hypothetical protein
MPKGIAIRNPTSFGSNNVPTVYSNGPPSQWHCERWKTRYLGYYTDRGICSGVTPPDSAQLVLLENNMLLTLESPCVVSESQQF